MPDRVSIRDLAKIAGVSRTTVSLALRGSHEVSAATRKKILALARKHDYRSHPAVNALMQQVGRGVRVHDEEVIAFIRSGSEPDEQAPGPLEMLEGAREEAHRLGYRVEVFWAGYKAAKSAPLARVLYHRGIRGVIWGAMPYPHPPIVFPWEKFVPVACTQSTGVVRLPTINIHHAKGMALVIEELRRRGADRIGFLGGELEDSRQDFGWLCGLDLFRHRGGGTNVAFRLCENPPGEKTALSWIRRHRLDALILTQDFFGKTAYLESVLPRVSLDVPTRELGRVAGLYQDAIQIGRHAVRSLAIRLANGILGLPDHPFSVVSQARFVEGDSLRQLAGRR
jgi:LacI family transcriptional regulator